ncbi:MULTISPECIES: SGNH/GDSL hydrolase family protein [unclassified Exiguobacterium]|uniref:SGNH/GDSL hydrolase family protein n=1 Tax=unclassified Exiguobacterium TaxID=2644629 RepID=UPI001BEB53B4|nr:MULTISPECIES: SGNH/GDSL hydrolase family protein [unclassified Exiguobacterium]
MTQEFKDHIVQHPNRFKRVPVAGTTDQFDMIPTWMENPSEVVQLGTPIDRQLFEGITSQLADKATKKTLATYFSPYKKKFSVENFSDLLNFHPTDDTGAKNNEWLLNDNKLKVNPANTKNLLWYNKKIQDGKISLIWENPNVSTADACAVGIMFRGSSFKDYFMVGVYSGNLGGFSNKVVLWQFINGVGTMIETITLTGGDVILKNNTPVSINVDFVGSSVKVRINGKVVMSNTDAKHKTFNLGLCGIFVTPNNYASSLNLLISGFSVEEKVYNALRSNFTEMLVVGDSIAFGTGSTPGNDWANKFKTQAQEIMPELNVTNIAVGGRNTPGALGDLIVELSARPNKYHLVLISCGINNARIDQNKRTTIKEAANDIANMIKLIKNVNAIPVLAVPTNVRHDVDILFPGVYGADSYSYFTQLVNEIRKVGISENVRMVDNYNILNNDFSLLTDGVHPNDVGYAKMADNLYNTIFNFD